MQDPYIDRARKLMMLRRPDIRERLSSTESDQIDDLLECYDLAVTARDHFSTDPDKASLHAEYMTICLEIEADVARTLGSEIP